MKNRRILDRAGILGAVLGGAVVTVCVAAGPAVAATPSTWTQKPKMPWLEVLGIYAGIPILLFVIIAGCVMKGSLMRGPRYRPGLSWWAEPQWFGAPAGGERGELTSGESAEAAGEMAAESSAAADADPVSGTQHAGRTRTGGASARW